MRKQTFFKIGKKMTILLVIFFVASLTAAAASAGHHGNSGGCGGNSGGCGGCSGCGGCGSCSEDCGWDGCDGYRHWCGSNGYHCHHSLRYDSLLDTYYPYPQNWPYMH